MGTIIVHRVAILNAFVRMLEETGAPVERAFRDVGLPFYALEDLDNYVPSARFYAFVARMARSEGIPDLGFRVGQRFGANCADPRMRNLLLQSPSMFRGLTEASKLTNRTVSRCHVGLKRSADGTRTYFYHQPSCRYRNEASDQVAWFGLMTLLGMARVYAGSGWRPAEIGVMSRRKPTRHMIDALPDTRIELGRQCSYIVLPHAEISLPPARTGAMGEDFDSIDYESISDCLVGSMKQVLRSYLRQESSLPWVAELCGHSGRTLQRQLRKRGTSFRRVLDEVRFEIARGMLSDVDVPVSDIANSLGYRHTTDFSRAFRRVSGLTPREFRRAVSTENRTL